MDPCQTPPLNPRHRSDTLFPPATIPEAVTSDDNTEGKRPMYNPKDGKPFHPVIEEFKRLIEHDPLIFKLFHEMFDEVPNEPPYNTMPGTDYPQVRNYKDMLIVFNDILTHAPEWRMEGGVFALPFNTVLIWPMATPAGIAAFTNPKVNNQIRKMFNVWAEFLVSPASRYVLNHGKYGWFGPEASLFFPDFDETYVCDPQAPYKGFKSWDNFFTRMLRPGVRPVEAPYDNSYVNNACESSVYRIASNVKVHDQFMLKGQPYSLDNMMNFDELVPQFAGGTVYQAFLDITHYHRWHSPINGKIHKVVNIPGAFFVESPTEGGFAAPNGPDPNAPVNSLAFITSTSTRCLIFIEADEPAIGLMCFVGVGMTDVSTCEITVVPGQVVKKGEQIGMFHFGGSTYCLVFRPQVQIEFNRAPPTGEQPATDIQYINTVLAKVTTGNTA